MKALSAEQSIMDGEKEWFFVDLWEIGFITLINQSKKVL